ncbi:MAG: OmpA family protein [Clostridia bacterium]|jgi:chemotaxis protein MotB|nr:OmpA family protein [Clostridiales bacterium]
MRARRSRGENDASDTGSWMTTYSDLVTLLLCFFVLLFSFSVIDAKKFEAIIRSFQGSLGVLDSGKTIDEDLYISQALQSDRLMREQLEAESLEWLYRQLDEYIKENALEATVVLGVEERGLLIRFRDQVLFDSGKAIIRKDAETIVQSIGEILKQYDRSIRVEGHTDNVPMNTFLYPSNWELSTARAVNVVKFLIEEVGISPVRLSAAGYGEYHPIADNDTAENRQKNRRVDVVILRNSFELEEPDYL